MNELLLLLLIAFTLISFFSLNKKMVSADFINPKLTGNKESHIPFNGITKVIYAAIPQKTKETYNRIWSVTATVGAISKSEGNEMVLMYHQSGATDLEPYANKNSAVLKNDTGRYGDDVCVISSISDMHYRHALLSLDGLE